jgi:membrane protease YdiL (CAAX protease family)
LEYGSPRHITLFVNPIFRDSWHSSMAVDLPRAGPFVLGIAPEFPAVTPNRAWLRMGHPTLSMWIAAATVALGSAVSLLLWFKLARPDVKWQAGLIPTWSPARLVLLGVGFALFNAALEEMIWRGVVFDALERTRLPTVPVVLMQAVSFGVAHLHGFPSGSVGILLASVYGATLGVLRARTRGLLVPFVTHAVTDFSIFEILIFLAHD